MVSSHGSAGINYPPYRHENLLLSGELSRWCWYGGLLNIVLKCTKQDVKNSSNHLMKQLVIWKFLT